LLGHDEEPPVPRLASTVILLRRGGKHVDRGLEVCMVQRNPNARFMPGVWVFPGGAVDAEDGEGEQGSRVCAVRELSEEVSVSVSVEDLVPYSRWITPRVVPIRFDTRFYLVLAPAHAPPEPDGEETVDAVWIEPEQALGRHGAGEMELVFPTIKHLESLLPFRSADEALNAARSRVVEPIEPVVIGQGAEARIVIPGESDGASD